MLRIAICDDEKIICAQLERLLREISLSLLQEIEIEVFFSGEELCRFLSEDRYFDIIFLDIELKMMNGIEVGKTIREEMLNETTQIVYVSGKDSYAMALFKVRPLDFLIKPFNYETISTVFETALRLIQKEEHFFTYQVGYTSCKIPVKDILYFESSNRKLKMVTTKGEETFYGSIDEVFKQIEKFNFLNIHKSYLVNYSYIIIFEYSQVTMSNGRVLPISQPRRKDIRALQFQLEGRG